jgi:hypothetical protein
VGNKVKNDPSQDFSTVNGTGTGHEASNTASYMMRKFSPKTQRLQLFYRSSKGYSAWSVPPYELHTSKTKVYENKILNKIFVPNLLTYSMEQSPS